MVAESFVKLPPLESGDRLTRTEFERRYSAMPHIKKAALNCLQCGLATPEHRAFVGQLQLAAPLGDY